MKIACLLDKHLPRCGVRSDLCCLGHPGLSTLVFVAVSPALFESPLLWEESLVCGNLCSISCFMSQLPLGLSVSSTVYQLLWPLSNVMYCSLQGVVLAATFAVSHNVAEAKPVAAGSETTSLLCSKLAERDWGVQQASKAAAFDPIASLIQPEFLKTPEMCARDSKSSPT